MPCLFERTSIKTLELENRSIRSATWSGVSDNRGYVSDRAVDFYRRLAEGGIGLIITGFQFVMPNGIAIAFQTGNYSDDMTKGLSRLADAVHESGGKLAAQLAHGGARANPDLFFEEGELWGPSPLPDALTGNTPKEMTKEEIRQAIFAYAAAASRTQKAGFDGVQIHGAHGYGINQFLSGATNRRSDAYGGDITGRYRFLGEVLEAVRGEVGKDYPVLIKLSGNDYSEGGLRPEEALYVARRLEEDGIDAIEVSAGSRSSANDMVPSRMNILREENEGYLAELSQRFKETVKIPVITVGGIRSLPVISKIFADGMADYVALSRPFIREPHLINRWRDGDTEKAKCVSCNGCYDTGLEGIGISCKVERKQKEKRER
jgi:2,4-dienoyl-CoA reductase-like NADH-dependent reductase (Old Yellow Enzyme family)